MKKITKIMLTIVLSVGLTACNDAGQGDLVETTEKNKQDEAIMITMPEPEATTIASDNNANMSYEKKAVKAGQYTCSAMHKRTDTLENFHMSVYESGEIVIWESIVQNSPTLGSWHIEDDILVVECDNYENCFKIMDDKLIFIGDKSTDFHFVALQDGQEIKRENDTGIDYTSYR